MWVCGFFFDQELTLPDLDNFSWGLMLLSASLHQEDLKVLLSCSSTLLLTRPGHPRHESSRIDQLVDFVAQHFSPSPMLEGDLLDHGSIAPGPSSDLHCGT